jgi:hypothetical protein
LECLLQGVIRSPECLTKERDVSLRSPAC